MIWEKKETNKHYSGDFLKDAWGHFPVRRPFPCFCFQWPGTGIKNRLNCSSSSFHLGVLAELGEAENQDDSKEREKSIGVKPSQKYFNGIFFFSKRILQYSFWLKPNHLIGNELLSSYLPFIILKKRGQFPMSNYLKTRMIDQVKI